MSCEDQAIVYTDVCTKWECKKANGFKEPKLRRMARDGHYWIMCPICLGSYGAWHQPKREMSLSRGERAVFQGLAEGLTCPEIAAREGWKSQSIAHTYAARAIRKLRCRTRLQAVVKWKVQSLTSSDARNSTVESGSGGFGSVDMRCTNSPRTESQITSAPRSPLSKTSSEEGR